MPNLCPLEHLTFASYVRAPKLITNTTGTTQQLRPNSSWEITELRATPAYGNPLPGSPH